MVNLKPTNNLTLPVRFRGAVAPRASANAFLRTFDFNELGRSTVKQNMFLYGGVILSRLIASAVRGHEIDSYNEVREHALRDLLGWTFWFMAVDPIKRTYLRCFAPKQYRNALVSNPYKAPAKPPETLWGQFAERVKKECSFIFKGGMPTAQQLDNRMTQMLKRAREASKELGDEAVKLAEDDVKKSFNKLARFRSFASGVGIVSAIGLLGIGIPLINIITTRRNVAEREAKKHGAMPVLQTNPYGLSNASDSFAFSGRQFKEQRPRAYTPSYLK